MSTDGEENRLGYSSSERVSSQYVFHVMGKLKTSYILCDLHSPWARAVMFWHLFSVLLRIIIQMSWCWLVQSHGRYYWVKKWTIFHGALCLCSRWHPQSVVLEETLFFRKKLTPLFPSQSTAAELIPQLLFLFPAARCEQLKTVCRYYI